MQRLTAYLNGTKEKRMTSDHHRYAALDVDMTYFKWNQLIHCMSVFVALFEHSPLEKYVNKDYISNKSNWLASRVAGNMNVHPFWKESSDLISAVPNKCLIWW